MFNYIKLNINYVILNDNIFNLQKYYFQFLNLIYKEIENK